MNLLYRYITQGRVEADRPHLSPWRVARMLLTRPGTPSASQQALLGKLTRRLPGDDQPGRPGQRLRRLAHARPGE
jgi:hypothetical protein